MTRPLPKLAALAVVRRGDNLLLVQRRNPPDAGLWGFPGGHVELGETALAAAARELHEETGVVATPETYLTNIDVILPGDDGQVQYHFLLAAVLCRYVSGTPQARDDVSDAGWFTLDDIEGPNLSCSAHVDRVARLALTV
ncbi:NUDIX hydrolase [uncultured Sulfitobacter sp.]|uniref:NUDIX hydrolase n=1 Tax=uncultured Sulfitobacter sp. TaxID=191468 RepID=UPI00263193A4|nr:NUDIX hydrolase [uncultured Sulfitobacter sp.]